MFRHAVAAIANNPKKKVATKLEFFNRTLRCSESEVSTTVSKIPAILGLSYEILFRKIEFLVNEAAMEPQYIVERPVLLALSLEKRLVARHYVMKVLREKGLLDSDMSFLLSSCTWRGYFQIEQPVRLVLIRSWIITAGWFGVREKYYSDWFFTIVYDQANMLLPDTYAAARAGVVPSRI